MRARRRIASKVSASVVSRDSGVRKGSVTGDTLPRMRRVAPLALVLVLGAAAPAAAKPAAPQLLDLRVTNGSTPFLGDGPLLTTVSPNGDGFRDAAHVRSDWPHRPRVALTVIQTDTAKSDPEASASNVVQRLRPRAFAPGAHELVWTPRRGIAPRTYVLQLTVSGGGP